MTVTKLILLGSFLLAPLSIAQTRGAVFEDPEVYRTIPLAVTPLRGELPKRVDLSAHFPQPGNQGKQGSCVGWASAYALKGYLEKKERSWSGRNNKERFSPAYIYNQIKLDGGGARITCALDLLMREGVSTMSAFPYDDKNDSKMPSPTIKLEAREYAIASWRKVNPQQIGSIKSHLSSGFPILIGMLVDEAFMKHRGDKPFSHSEQDTDQGGHAMCAVGYDDSKQAVKVINSWGTNWGTGGYAWISYPTFKEKVCQAYVVQDVIVYHPDQPDQPEQKDLDPVPTEQSPWVFSYSTDRKISAMELRVRSERELWRARNEIYARHGYAFQSDKGKRYSSSLGKHYTNRGKSAAEVEATFNKTERYNIALILSYEKGRPSPRKPKAGQGWIFADSSSRYLRQSEVATLDKAALWRARNEIFARNGYIFQSRKGKELADFLGPLYEARSSDMDAVYSAMNPVEQTNVLLLRRAEKTR